MNRLRLMLLTALGLAVACSIGAILLQARHISKLMHKIPVPAVYEDFLLSSAVRGPPVGPPYYSITRNDRSGMVVTEMLNAYAYCYRHNRLYGGSCPEPHRNGVRPPHEAEAQTILHALGLYGNPLRFLPHCPDKNKKAEGVLLERELYHTHVTKRIWTPSFVRHMQSLVHVPDKPTRQHTNNDTHTTTNTSAIGEQRSLEEELEERYIVAVHIRRGDVHPCQHQGRYLPNSHYLRLLHLYLPQQYRDKSHHKVYIFSETWSFENFTVFERSPYNVELALDSDLTAVWQTMATADLVLLSKSTFSLVPAMLNGKGTVVYTQFSRRGLPGWIVAPVELSTVAAAEVQVMANQSCDKPHLNPWLRPNAPP
jgi:hypothetical protein